MGFRYEKNDSQKTFNLTNHRINKFSVKKKQKKKFFYRLIRCKERSWIGKVTTNLNQSKIVWDGKCFRCILKVVQYQTDQWCQQWFHFTAFHRRLKFQKRSCHVLPDGCKYKIYTTWHSSVGNIDIHCSRFRTRVKWYLFLLLWLS